MGSLKAWVANSWDQVSHFFHDIQQDLEHSQDVLETAHAERNVFNKCPTEQPQEIGQRDIDGDGELEEAAIDHQGHFWEQRPEWQSLFHNGRVFTHELGEGRGEFECEYDENGQYQPGGTFNYVETDDAPGHFFADVAPHFAYGGDAGYASPDLTELVPASVDSPVIEPSSTVTEEFDGSHNTLDTPSPPEPELFPLPEPEGTLWDDDSMGSPAEETPAWEDSGAGDIPSFATSTFAAVDFDTPQFTPPSQDSQDLADPAFDNDDGSGGDVE